MPPARLLRLIESILDNPHAAQNIRVFKNSAAKGLHIIRHLLETLAMTDRGAILFSQTNRHHFHHTALIRSPKGCVISRLPQLKLFLIIIIFSFIQPLHPNTG